MKKLLRRGAVLFLILVFAIVLFAIIRQETYPSAMKQTLKNPALHAYYESTGTVPDASTHDMIDRFDYTGTVQAKHLTLIPAVGQLQISVRYGKAAQEELQKSCRLPSLPALTDERIFFRLRAMAVKDGAFSGNDMDLSGDEILSCDVLYPNAALPLTQGRHQYFRFVFDGIDFGCVNCAYLDMMFGDGEEPFASIIIYHKDVWNSTKKAVSLTKEDCAPPPTEVTTAAILSRRAKADEN